MIIKFILYVWTVLSITKKKKKEEEVKGKEKDKKNEEGKERQEGRKTGWARYWDCRCNRLSSGSQSRASGSG